MLGIRQSRQATTIDAECVLAAGTLCWHCKTSSFSTTDFVVCGCFLEFNKTAQRKTFGYSLQMSARRIVQSDFSMLPCRGSET